MSAIKIANNGLVREEENSRVRIFIENVASGVPLFDALTKAGLQNKYDAFMLLERNDCQQLLNSLMKGRTNLIHAPKALQFLADTINDPRATRRVKVDCAKHLLALAGFQPPKVMTTAQKDYGAPSEMTAHEIQAQIIKLEHELNQKAKAAKVVNPPAAEPDIFC